MSRNIARALVPEQGPEAAAIVNLNSEETRTLGEKKQRCLLGDAWGESWDTAQTVVFFFWGGGGRLLYNAWKEYVVYH